MKPGALLIGSYYCDVLNRRVSREDNPRESSCGHHGAENGRKSVRESVRPASRGYEGTRDNLGRSLQEGFGSRSAPAGASDVHPLAMGSSSETRAQNPRRLTDEEPAQSPLSRDPNKRARLDSEGGTSPAERTPGDTGAVELSRGRAWKAAYPPAGNPQLKLIPQSGANAEPLSETRVTIQNGSTTRHSPCSERMQANSSTTSLDTRQAPATPIRRTIQLSDGDQTKTSSASSFIIQDTGDHSSTPTCTAADGGRSKSASHRSAGRSSALCGNE